MYRNINEKSMEPRRDPRLSEETRGYPRLPEEPRSYPRPSEETQGDTRVTKAAKSAVTDPNRFSFFLDQNRMGEFVQTSCTCGTDVQNFYFSKKIDVAFP